MPIPVVVGYRRKPRLIASLFPLDCPQCSKETIHVHSEVSENPTLYHIPIPVGSHWTSIQCSVCGLATRIDDENEKEKIRSLSKGGVAPFRICPKCVAHNEPDAAFCRVCDEPLKDLLFPKKTGARIVAVLLTALFGLLLFMMCYAFCASLPGISLLGESITPDLATGIIVLVAVIVFIIVLIALGSVTFRWYRRLKILRSTPKAGPSEVSVSKTTPSKPEHGARAPILMPSEPSAPPPDIEEVPACSACGRQDETLRVVAYPYVFSLVVVTFRRTFAGLWCRKHRNLWLALASLITATIGWIGIPFGFILTPIALFKLAGGGDQPVELNVHLLEDLAEHKLKEGDPQGAIRCLEACLQFLDDQTIQERLRELYRTYRPPAHERDYPQVLPFVGAMLGAAVVGAAIGVLDNVIDMGLSSFGLFGKEVPIYLAILSWAPLVAMAFMGGLILFRLIEGALARAKCCQRSLSVGLAVVSASLALYGLPEIRAIRQYVQMLLSGLAFEPLKDAILTSGAVLTRGGVWVIWDAIKSGGTPGAIYALVLLACAAYYVITSLSAAMGTVKWQQRVAVAREKVAAQTDWALAPGWVPIISVVLGLAFFASLFPQQGIVDYFEAITRNQYGVALLEQGKLDEAIQEFQEAIHLKPNFALAHSNLGWAYFNQGNYEAAVDGFEAAIELNPNDANTYKSLGFAYYWLGTVDMADTAAEAFKTALELAPEDAEALAGLGLVCLVQEQLDDAESHLTTALGLAPDLYLTHYGLGGLYLRKANLDKAVSHYQEAIRLNPQFLLPCFNLGLAYMGRGEFEEAAEQFEASMELQPDWGIPHAWLAYAYYQLDQPDSMEREIQSASALQAEDASTSYVLGIVYGNLRRFSEAEAQLLRAIELSPDSEGFYIHLAYVYSAQKKFDLALQMCDRALELHKDYADAYVARGDVYIYQEKLDQALEELSHALEIAGEDSDVHSYLSFIYFHKGQTAEALKEAKEAVRLQPYSAGGHMNLAFAYHVQGQLDLALAAAQEAVRLAPKGDRPHYILGLCYMDKGEPEKALIEFERFLELYWDRAYVRDYKVEAEAYLVQLRDVVRAAPPPASLHAQWKTYTTEDGLADNWINAISVDGEGALWFGTWGGGVSRFEGQNWTTYIEEDGLANNKVSLSIVLDTEGALWFSTVGGVSRFDGQDWTTYTIEDGLANNEVYAIFADKEGTLWFGTKGGVSRFDGENWTTYTVEDGLANDWVSAIVVDREEVFWFSTVGGGVNRFDGENWTTYTAEDGLASNRVLAIVVDGEEAFWFGTDSGVSHFDGENWTTYTAEDGLADNWVNAIAVDGEGALWFGTNEGVSRFDGETWTTYTREDGLVDNRVYTIAVDTEGALWFGTVSGVSRFRPE